MAFAFRKIAWGLTAGAAAIGFVAAQPPTPPPQTSVKAVETPPADPVKSADPLGTMLVEARAAFGKYRDYSCIFTRQERIKDVLGAEQVAEMKVRVKPYSVAVRFAKPDAVAGMEELFVSGTRSGKMKFKAAGSKGLNGYQTVAVDDPKIMAETRHPVTELGISATLDRLTSIATREKTLGNALEVFTSDFQFVGKTVTRYEIIASRAHAHRYAYRMLVYVDKETKLPLRFEAYDSPKPGTTTGDLLEAYSYTDVKFNVGIGDSVFE